MTIREITRIILHTKKMTHAEFSLTDGEKWDESNFFLIEKIIKCQYREKVTLILHKQDILFQSMFSGVVLKMNKESPYLRIEEQINAVRSVYERI